METTACSRPGEGSCGPRIRGIFLLCPSIVSPAADRDRAAPRVASEEPRWREAALALGASESDLSDYEEHAVLRSLAAFQRTRAEVIAGIRVARLGAVARYLSGSEGFSFDRLRRADPRLRPDEGAFDPVFEGPACFFLGRQDRSVGWRDALRLADRYPRASYCIVDGAGHNAQIERPAEFARAFESWLADCEAERSSAALGSAALD